MSTSSENIIINSLKKNNIFDLFKKVISRFPEEKIFLVGGAVRDALLDKEVKDLDFSTPLTPTEVQKLLKDEKVLDVGVRFGTLTWVLPEGSVEITTFRRKEEYENHRHPQKLEFGTSFEEDLIRRDFTINAIMFSYDLKKGVGKVKDPFSGVQDLKNKTLKAIGPSPQERFEEDALRVLRLLRFHLNLGFDIDSQTKKDALKRAPLLKKVSLQRRESECVKTFHQPIETKKLRILNEEFLEGPSFDFLNHNGFQKLNPYQWLFLCFLVQKKFSIQLIQKRLYKKIVLLYHNILNSEDDCDIKKQFLAYVEKNHLSGDESEQLWRLLCNVKEEDLKESIYKPQVEDSKSFKEKLETLKKKHSGKCLGQKILELKIESLFSKRL